MELKEAFERVRELPWLTNRKTGSSFFDTYDNC